MTPIPYGISDITQIHTRTCTGATLQTPVDGHTTEFNNKFCNENKYAYMCCSCCTLLLAHATDARILNIVAQVIIKSQETFQVFLIHLVREGSLVSVKSFVRAYQICMQAVVDGACRRWQACACMHPRWQEDDALESAQHQCSVRNCVP